MKSIPQYTFYKTKYGRELLIDVVELKYIKRFLYTEPVHTLGYYDITLITEGEGEFYVDDIQYDVRKGDIIFSASGQIRKWNTGTIENGYALIFAEEFILSFFNDRDFLRKLSYFNSSGLSGKFSLAEEEYDTIIHLVVVIKKEISAYRNESEHILRALLYQVLSLLNRIYQEENKQDNVNNKIANDYVRRFVDLVNENFRSEHSLSFYANKLCITGNYMSDLIKDALGVSAKQYIHNKLILEAKRLLLYTTLSVSEIAMELNYEDTSYFIRMFRSSTGVSPLTFRKKS